MVNFDNGVFSCDCIQMCFAGGLFALGASETLRVFHQTKTRDASNDGVLASGSRTAPDPLWHATLRKLVDVQPSHMKLGIT